MEQDRGNAIRPLPEAPGEQVALPLSIGEWGVVAVLVMGLLAIAPYIPFRPRSPVLDPDYRMPFPLSSRYDVYQRMSKIQSEQFPTLLIGDSVVWGQCALRDQTLSHHLNVLTHQPLFANAAMSGLHPIALEGLIEYHAPGIQSKNVLLQLDPLWFAADRIIAGPASISDELFNHPGLIPRLAGKAAGGLKEAVDNTASRWLQRSPLAGWAERLAEARIDFLSWSLDHPYESPLTAITSALPPIEDTRGIHLTPWVSGPGAVLHQGWLRLEESGQWRAFLRLVRLLERRSNRVFVVVGPMNEWMMDDEMRRGYQDFKAAVDRKLKESGIDHFIPPVLESSHYGDICHPLGAGNLELARELLRTNSKWLLRVERP